MSNVVFSVTFVILLISANSYSSDWKSYPFEEGFRLFGGKNRVEIKKPLVVQREKSHSVKDNATALKVVNSSSSEISMPVSQIELFNSKGWNTPEHHIYYLRGLYLLANCDAEQSSCRNTQLKCHSSSNLCKLNYNLTPTFNHGETYLIEHGEAMTAILPKTFFTKGFNENYSRNVFFVECQQESKSCYRRSIFQSHLLRYPINADDVLTNTKNWKNLDAKVSMFMNENIKI